MKKANNSEATVKQLLSKVDLGVWESIATKKCHKMAQWNVAQSANKIVNDHVLLNTPQTHQISSKIITEKDIEQVIKQNMIVGALKINSQLQKAQESVKKRKRAHTIMSRGINSVSSSQFITSRRKFLKNSFKKLENSNPQQISAVQTQLRNKIFQKVLQEQKQIANLRQHKVITHNRTLSQQKKFKQMKNNFSYDYQGNLFKLDPKKQQKGFSKKATLNLSLSSPEVQKSKFRKTSRLLTQRTQITQKVKLGYQQSFFTRSKELQNQSQLKYSIENPKESLIQQIRGKAKLQKGIKIFETNMKSQISGLQRDTTDIKSMNLYDFKLNFYNPISNFKDKLKEKVKYETARQRVQTQQPSPFQKIKIKIKQKDLAKSHNNATSISQKWKKWGRINISNLKLYTEHFQES